MTKSRHYNPPPPSPSPLSVNATAIPESAVEEIIGSLSILLQLFLLGIAFVVGHILRRRKFYYIHEASAALIIGLFAGTVANIYNFEERFRKWLNFREEFFLLFLLPPIIFESGFSLQPKPFFSNFGAICIFSFLGTFIAAVVTAVLVYVCGALGLMYGLTFLESLAFGSLISATDPVTILAIFQELGCDTNLYAVVFGESVLNDSVAIVMYRTVMSVLINPSAPHSLFSLIRYSFVIFAFSLSIGVTVALSSALLFKYAGLSVKNLHNLECCLMVLFPYMSYMIAESISLSGIIAILFCGILMKHYTFPNLSKTAQSLSAGFFQIISSLAETFTFIYMGVEIALGESQSWSHISFILFSIIIIFVARAVNVFPCTRLINFLRPKNKSIPESHQKVLWFSGLRGAMAFALALQFAHDMNDAHGNTVFTATTAIVVLTVLVIGGSTSTMLERLHLAGDHLEHLHPHPHPHPHPHHLAKNNSDTRDYSDEEGLLLLHSPRNEHDKSTPPKNEKHDIFEVLSPHDILQRRIRLLQESTPSFMAIDSMYLRPFFTSQSENDLQTLNTNNNNNNSNGSNSKNSNNNNGIEIEIVSHTDTGVGGSMGNASEYFNGSSSVRKN